MELHLRTRLGGNRYEVTGSLDESDPEPSPGDLMTLWDDMGVVRVLAVDGAPEGFRLVMAAAEIRRFRCLIVETTETVGPLPNLGGAGHLKIDQAPTGTPASQQLPEQRPELNREERRRREKE